MVSIQSKIHVSVSTGHQKSGKSFLIINPKDFENLCILLDSYNRYKNSCPSPTNGCTRLNKDVKVIRSTNDNNNESNKNEIDLPDF